MAYFEDPSQLKALKLRSSLSPTTMLSMMATLALPSLPLSLGASLLALLQGFPSEKAQAQGYFVSSLICVS